jgi:hypothetical protein
MTKKIITAALSVAVIICGASATVAAATKPVTKAATNYCAPATLPVATSNEVLNSYFSNQFGPGWVGGDGTYSTKLPDGRQAWTFSDTLIGTANVDGTASFTGMPHNTELVGTAGQLSSNYAGSYSAPASLIPGRSSSSWWWAGATLVENNSQLIFVNDFDARNMFGYFTGNSGIAVMSLPTGSNPTYSRLQSLPTDSTTQWGSALASDATYNYVYGLSSNSDNGTFYGMKVARVVKGKTLTTSAWQYWNGTGWVSGESHAVSLATTNTLTGVTKQPSWMGSTGYVATSIPSGVFNDNVLQLSFACSPQGPWSTPQTVAPIPEIAQYHNEMAYIPTFHPELSSSTTGLAVSYNVNTTDGFGALAQNIHEYQPRFLQLR